MSEKTISGEVERLSIRDGDILVLFLGEPTTGWIPDQASESRTLTHFEDALRARGLKDFTIITTHYGVRPLVIRPEHKAKT
jgi:hypothetical protein